MRKRPGRKIILVVAALFLMTIYLTACESDTDNANEASENDTSESEKIIEEKEVSSGKIVMPNSTADYIGSEWTIETITDHFKELGFNDIRTVPCEPDDDNFDINIQEMVIETGLFSDGPWEAGDEFSEDSEITIYYNEFPALTVEDCPDLVTVLTSKAMNYLSFAKEYDGRYVKFDAYVTSHITYDGGTSHIIDITGGDYDGRELEHYDEEYYNGLIIRIGDRSWDNDIDKSVDEGQNVTVSGRIDLSWSEYYKQLYVEGLSLTKR